ncbi:MAG: response regulator transcription factor [Pirellulales bacterium]|nr:response regulator transcription factor [Pirellulales bacterium]
MDHDKARVFVIDDDPAARLSLEALITSHGLQATSFSSAEDFLACSMERLGTLSTDEFEEIVESNWPDCLICDLRLTGMSGIALQNELTRLGLDIPLIIITAYGNAKSAVEAMEGGAVTFLEKPYDDDTLWAAVHRSLEESTKRQRITKIRHRLAQLTDSEFEVLNHILRGTTNKEIKEELGLALRTVELRRSNIMKKMGAQSIAELVRLTFEAQHTGIPRGPHGRTSTTKDLRSDKRRKASDRKEDAGR